MQKLFILLLALSSFSVSAEETTFCQCKLIRAATSHSTGGSKARVDLELMLAADGHVGRLSTLGTYFGESKNWNATKAVDRAQEKCEDAMKENNACD